MKNRWLDRSISHPGPYLTLCLSEEEYKSALKACRVLPCNTWIATEWSNATVHHLTNPKNELVSVVCLRVDESRSAIQIAGLLVHESVHIWQEYAARIGETNPGCEQEAYAIQIISQNLMTEYARRVTE